MSEEKEQKQKAAAAAAALLATTNAATENHQLKHSDSTNHLHQGGRLKVMHS